MDTQQICMQFVGCKTCRDILWSVHVSILTFIPRHIYLSLSSQSSDFLSDETHDSSLELKIENRSSIIGNGHLYGLALSRASCNLDNHHSSRLCMKYNGISQLITSFNLEESESHLEVLECTHCRIFQTPLTLLEDSGSFDRRNKRL